MGVEDHLLGLARVGADQEHAAVAEADVGDLDLAGHAREPRGLVAPVELEGLARREGERDEDGLRARAALRHPAPGVAAHAVVAAGVALLAQALEQAHVAQALALRLGALRGEQLVEAGDVAVELGPRLTLALVGEGGLVGAQRLAREAQLPRDLADAPVLVAEEPPDLGDGLHDQHSRLAPWL